MHLSAISYTHGAARPIADLDEPDCADPQWAEDLLVTCRESGAGVMDMAYEVCVRTLATAGVLPEIIICATETELGTSASDAGSQLATALGCPSATVLFVSGHGCGNLGLLLKVARGLTGSAPVMLLVTADRVGGGPRVMADGLSVLSDGAAAVLATRDAPAADTPVFVVQGLSSGVDAAGSTTRAALGAQRRTVQLARKAAAGLVRKPKEFTRVLFNNYRLSAQKFMCAAGGFTAEQLLVGPVPDHAHTFAADLLVNCDVLSRSGELKPGDRLALAATGPNSWALADVEIRSA